MRGETELGRFSGRQHLHFGQRLRGSAFKMLQLLFLQKSDGDLFFLVPIATNSLLRLCQRNVLLNKKPLEVHLTGDTNIRN